MKSIITISRQFGSEGKNIGERLAQEYNIKCYDREILERTAKESGLCEEIIRQNDEKATSSLLYSIVMDTYSYGYHSPGFFDVPISQKIFLAQFESIRNIAEEGPCVVVGRCADYVLEEFSNCINVFVISDMETRVRRVMERHNISEQKARDMVVKTDKQRMSYYTFYTDRKWGDPGNYDLTIDTSVIGVEGAVALIKHFVEIKEKAMQ